MAIARLLALAGKYPDAGKIWLEIGLLYDRRGREAEAIPFYEKALKLGMSRMTDEAALYASVLRCGTSVSCRKQGKHFSVALKPIQGVSLLRCSWHLYCVTSASISAR
jgi:hypothetical protein